MHHSSQAVSTMSSMTGSGSGWEGWPFRVLCAGSVLDTLRLTPYTTSHLGVHQTPWWRILMEGKGYTLLYSLGSLIPRPGDEAIGRGGTRNTHCAGSWQSAHLPLCRQLIVTTSTLHCTAEHMPPMQSHLLNACPFGVPHPSL